MAGRDGGIVGYVPKRFLLSAPGKTTGLPVEPDHPVYAEDLRTLVGRMVAGKGFVPLGVDPRTVPNIPVRQAPSFAAPSGKPTSLTIYVCNTVGRTAWSAVFADGDIVEGQGYSVPGVGCIDIEAGHQLVLLDRSPQELGVQTLRTIYTRGQASGLPTLWVDISADGAVSQGEGVPAWWTGAPQGC